MSTGIEKLQRDLAILEAMASEMDEYLMSDVLFWRMIKGSMPMLTLGGYLMRQHRLLALRHLLDKEEQGRLDAAVIKFNMALDEKIVRFEQKTKTELEARIRQWSEYLRDLDQAPESAGVNYGTAVDTRAMLEAILDKLRMPPYQVPARLPEQVRMLDTNLRGHWRPGDFIWPDEWKPAYPVADYWWLYGRPK